MARRAFTLIELLVVVAIIAILMAVLLPALQRAREQGKRAVRLSTVKQFGLSWVLYADDNDQKIVNSCTIPDFEGAEAQSSALRVNITAERNGGGELSGSEILDAGEFLTPFRCPILFRGNNNAEGSLAADPSAIGIGVTVDSAPDNRGRCT